MSLCKKIALLFSICFILMSCEEKSSAPVIGIIAPLQHTAIDEIIAGFSETLQKNYAKPITIKIENAQNDINLQRAIIQKMQDAHYTLIVPIGLAATQMSVGMVQNQPILSLASTFSDEERHRLKNCNTAVVRDEIPAKKIIEFIHAAYPKLNQLTLIHSSAEKVFSEVNETIETARTFGINVKHQMINTLPELYTLSQNISENTQALYILKDHLIVSGVGTLEKAAAQKHIPLIASDDGSVQHGAGFSLGIHERDIGSEGAKLAFNILNGTSPCALPIKSMTQLTVFINTQSLKKQNQNVSEVIKAAKSLNYHVELIN